MRDVTLTDAQFAQLGLQVGEIPSCVFSGYVTANGKIVAEPQSEASLTSYMGANIRQIVVREGQTVQRGQVVAYLAHPDILSLQARYLAAYSQSDYVAKEYQRQQTLLANNVGAGRDFQKVEAEYRSLNSELRTTAAQLKLLNIDIHELQNGRTVDRVPLVSPIAGTVERIFMETGQYADPSQPMMKIANNDHLYVDLLVFEKDISLLSTGQNVRVEPTSLPGKEFRGTVFSIGKALDAEARAVHVRANLTGDQSGLIAGMYVRARLATGARQVSAIAQEGVVGDHDKWYVFEATKQPDGWLFHPIEIRKGAEEEGMVELLGSVGPRVALNGAYYLISEMKKGETGEED